MFGTNLVSCFFTRNWTVRESGLKHLSKAVVSVLAKKEAEGTPQGEDEDIDPQTMFTTLEICLQIVGFMCADPVYRVYVASLVCIFLKGLCGFSLSFPFNLLSMHPSSLKTCHSSVVFLYETMNIPHTNTFSM